MILHSLSDDVMGSLRRMRRHPRNPVVLVCMLALAIGSVIGIFDVAYQTLRGELAYKQPNRIVVASGTLSDSLVSPYDWQSNPLSDTVFERLAEYHFETANLDSQSGTQRLLIACVTPKFFSVLGVRMTLGSDLPDASPPSPDSKVPWLPIIISHNMWRNYFGSDQGIVGHSVTLKFLYPYRFQVAGVAPPGVSFPRGVDAWIPEHLVSSSFIQTAAPPNSSRATIGLLRPGISLSAAEIAIHSWPRKEFLWPASETIELVSLREFLVGKFYNLGPLLWLVTIFFLVLTVAAAVSVFRLDFEERRGEFGIRKILGATPGRLFRSLNFEMGAILLLAWGASLLVRSILGRITVAYLQIPFVFQTRMTWIDMIMSVGTVGAVAVLIGVAQGHGLGVFTSFDRFKNKPAYGGNELRVVSRNRFPLQVVPATMIVVMAILLGRSAYGVMHIDTGIQPTGVIVCEVALPYDEEQFTLGGMARNLPRDEFNRQLKIRSEQFNRLMNSYFTVIGQEVRGHAEITEMGIISLAPYNGYPAERFGVYVSRTPTQPSPSEMRYPALLRSESPGAVPALGMRLIYGRNFSTDLDGGVDQDTVIINEAMAERIGAGASALDQYIAQQGDGFPPARIIGIVQNVHETDLFTPAQPTVYYPFSEYGSSDVNLVFRSPHKIPFQEAYSLVQSSVHSVVPGAVVLRFEPLDEMVWSAGALTRYCAYLLLALAVLGVFMAGLCAWARSIGEFRRREHEIGIRLALGAEAGQLVRFIVGGQIKSSFMAASIGGVIAWWFSRLVGYLFYGVNASGIGNYVVGIMVIMIYIFLISGWAARGTIRQNPRDLIGRRSF